MLELRWWAQGLGRRVVCKVWRTWLTWPPSPGKLDRGVKNEPGRAGARKARESKSNLDPDLKGIRLRGARHLSILSIACHAGLASPVSREGTLRPLGGRPRPIKCHTVLGRRMGRPAAVKPRKRETLCLEAENVMTRCCAVPHPDDETGA